MGALLVSEPSAALLNLSALAYLLGITVLTWCITRFLEHYSIWSRKAWVDMPWSRLCLLLALIDSWVYLFFTGMLLYGAPSHHEKVRCGVAMLACTLLYGGGKGLIYLCLIERVHAVWGNGRPRRRSPIYILCLILMLPLGLIAGIMIAQGFRYVHNGYCVIGISRLSSVLLTSYDAFISLFLTVMFVAPLAQSTIRSAWLRTVAIRALIATSIALVTTVVNGILLYVREGQELIWFCLGVCAADMVVNCMAVSWAMQGPKSARDQSVHISTIRQTRAARPDTNVGDSLGTDGTRKGTITFLTSLPNYGQPHDDVLSQDTTITSSVSTTFERPKPVFQSPCHVVRIIEQTRGSQTSLHSTTEQPVKHSDQDDSIQEMGLVRTIKVESEVDPNLERAESANGRRSPSVPPPQ